MLIIIFGNYKPAVLIRNIFLYLILLTLFIPAIKFFTGMPGKDYELNGYNEKKEKPFFSWATFFSSQFQDEITQYIQENVGFKGYLIALKNQIDYSLFNKLNYGIEQGADKQLFYWNHIETHCRTPSFADDSMYKKGEECLKLKLLLDSLHTRVVFVLAPGKPAYYQDKLPERYIEWCDENNDYRHVKQVLAENKLEIIDFNAWFKKLRSESKYPLFPRLGIHWSVYGASIAADSLAKYAEQKLHINLPDYVVAKTEVTDIPRMKDQDLFDLLNLPLPMQSDSLAYPQFWFTKPDTIHKKPKVLFIGDSFTWTMLDTKMLQDFYSDDSRFWFYKRELYDLQSRKVCMDANQVSLYGLLKGTDIVFFLSTEVLYHRFDHGFSNALFAHPASIDSLKHYR